MVGESRPPSESDLPGLPGYHPYNAQPWLVSVASGATALGIASVILRLLARRLNSMSWWWDDWMVAFSGLWSMAALGLLFDMRSCGLGLHADVVDPERVIVMLKELVAAETLYAWSLGWTKLSVLLMYYRVFRVRHFKVTAYAIGILVMSWVACVTFLFIFTCAPVEKLWYPDVPGRCISQTGTWIANGVSTIITDLMILLLPAPHIWRLQARKGIKIGVCVSFGLGGFVVFASAYRVSVLLTYDPDDPTYTLTPTVGWTAIEISAGVISACLPTMLPVVALVGRWLGLTRFLQALSSTHDTGTSHYDPTKSRAIESTAPLRSFPNGKRETSRPRDRGSSAGRSSTPSIYIYEQQAWGMGDDEVPAREYPLRGPGDNTSGESILLQEMNPKGLEQDKPQRSFS